MSSESEENALYSVIGSEEGKYIRDGNLQEALKIFRRPAYSIAGRKEEKTQ